MVFVLMIIVAHFGTSSIVGFITFGKKIYISSTFLLKWIMLLNPIPEEKVKQVYLGIAEWKEMVKNLGAWLCLLEK